MWIEGASLRNGGLNRWHMQAFYSSILFHLVSLFLNLPCVVCSDAYQSKNKDWIRYYACCLPVHFILLWICTCYVVSYTFLAVSYSRPRQNHDIAGRSCRSIPPVLGTGIFAMLWYNLGWSIFTSFAPVINNVSRSITELLLRRHGLIYWIL